jgi:hypothetical protein
MLTRKIVNACERYRRKLDESRAALEESIADLEQPKPGTTGKPPVGGGHRRDVQLIRRLGHSR